MLLLNFSQTFIKIIHGCLKIGGRLEIADLFLSENRTQPYNAALFSLTMLMHTKTGRTYGLGKTKFLLKNIGFAKFKSFELIRGSSVIEAEKN